MIGLMTLWFGPLAEQAPGLGYFYLCPTCYDECIEPHIDEVLDKLARMHPSAEPPSGIEGDAE